MSNETQTSQGNTFASEICLAAGMPGVAITTAAAISVTATGHDELKEQFTSPAKCQCQPSQALFKCIFECFSCCFFFLSNLRVSLSCSVKKRDPAVWRTGTPFSYLCFYFPTEMREMSVFFSLSAPR